MDSGQGVDLTSIFGDVSLRGNMFLRLSHIYPLVLSNWDPTYLQCASMYPYHSACGRTGLPLGHLAQLATAACTVRYYSAADAASEHPILSVEYIHGCWPGFSRIHFHINIPPNSCWCSTTSPSHCALYYVMFRHNFSMLLHQAKEIYRSSTGHEIYYWLPIKP